MIFGEEYNELKNVNTSYLVRNCEPGFLKVSYPVGAISEPELIY